MVKRTRDAPLTIAFASIFTAFVCIATIIFSIYVPSTEGFFNMGESMVFLSALLFGPFVGAFAGGVGSMLADLLLGYPHYALATLIIKACEGYVVGRLGQFTPTFQSQRYWKVFTLLLGMIAGSLLGVVGALRYSGQTEVMLGFASFALFIPTAVWLILGIIVVVVIAGVGFMAEPEFGWTIFSVVIGGFVMVTGYFLYQMFFIAWLFNIQVVAIAEIPVNIGQMIIGAIIAVPIAKVAWRTFPQLSRAQRPQKSEP